MPWMLAAVAAGLAPGHHTSRAPRDTSATSASRKVWASHVSKNRLRLTPQGAHAGCAHGHVWSFLVLFLG